MGAPPRRTCAARRTSGLRPWQKGNDKLHTRGGVWPCCRLARAICYGALNRGVAELTSLSDLRLARIAAIGALVAALGLAGCGRKGGPDPPPGATAGDTSPSRPAPDPALGPDGKVIPSRQGP